jgi:hypothetical protein
MGKDQRQQIYVVFVADIDIKILGVPSLLGPGMPFLDRVFFPVRCHPWIYDGMDGWKASRKTTTTSFTICYYYYYYLGAKIP